MKDPLPAATASDLPCCAGEVTRGTLFSRSLFLLVAMTAVVVSSHRSSAAEPQDFFREHCVNCHGAEKQKGELRLDSLQWRPSSSENLERWQAIVDRIDAGEMPPENQPSPTSDQRAAIVTSLRKRIAEAAAASSGSRRVILRRLNRAQFRNSIRDLLNIDVTIEDPTDAFPADDEEDGFDNLGEVLQMSDFLLRQYLKVARISVDRATFVGEQPEPETHTLRNKKSRRLNFKSTGNDPDRDDVLLYLNDERAPGDPRGQQLINCREGAPHDGWYEFTFDVESRGRGKFANELRVQKRDDYQIYHAEDLHRFEIYVTAPAANSQIQTRPRRLVVSLDLPDNERLEIKRRFWLPKGWRVEIGFGNAFSSSANTLLEILDAEFDPGAFAELSNPEQRRLSSQRLVDLLDKIDGPRIIIHDVTETGPTYQQWPPVSHLIVHGKPGQSLQEHLLEFAERAFRRPVTREQIAPYVRLAETSPEGIRTAIEAILCSPRFIYLFEQPGQLDDHAVASRLSYFLWNTIPDDALLKDAEQGRLSDREVVTAHVDRMLDDPRSDEFVQSFVWAWLKLQNTIEMAPDPMKFNEYHRNRIGAAMIAETNSFFRHLLDENLPLQRFIDADFAIINADLARLYGLSGVLNTTARFQRVALDGSRHRGGLLGQASVLTASANGVDTSPVKRGIWILENLLGAPPDPPPPNVEVPEPDARGELTIRQLYAKHRTVESCNDCHKKIDPLGFALENFDAIGAWRTEYESGNEVDPSGRMPSGEPFNDVSGLKRIMSRNLDPFFRNLTVKLMTYATGRTIQVTDRGEIDRIVALLNSDQTGLRDLVKLVVTSDIFLTK